MSKQLRATIKDDGFHRFKRIKHELGLSTNDEVIIELMETYEEHQKLLKQIEDDKEEQDDK